MKRFRVLVLFAAVGLIAYQGREIPTYAASNGIAAVGSVAMPAQTSTVPTADSEGAAAYASHCAICHGEQREGILPGFPPLLGISHQKTNQQIADLIHTGKGRMPGFPSLPLKEVTSLVRYLASGEMPITSNNTGTASAGVHQSGLAEIGGPLFQQNCAFCHGRDTQGGETGPDLTRSKLVLADVNGDKISEVVRNGRPEKKMPAFNFSNQEILSLAAFIHAQEARAVSQKGSRKGVDIADLQTGNVAAGKKYFNGAGGCAKCHTPTGDLAGIATRYEGLQLEERMLYPRDAKSRLTVTLPSGESVTGILAYRDEFTVGLRDNNGIYRSWLVSNVKYSVDAPVNAHVDLFSKYTDADIHNLMAYIQTLR
ncbi:c-type cytochrome [Granulicella arctica]|uniref:Cbb3-type cytochrome c oxidase subunit III n=1 Tax=Granulicella arctica TaxID=940613 RepID=A0A7Y9TUR6_9BACT|nr:c-type cytochrome [Granulicella arctica]NYF81118.1 cbb3-type cytochrome c oxidase subunit III [Granulicella arctica]